jgi:formylglycine-generating enzyme required for sulfatase activity
MVRELFFVALIVLLSGNADAAAVKDQGGTSQITAAAQAFQSADFPRAAALFRAVVAADPNNGLAWHFLGQSLAQTGDLVGARKAYEKSLIVTPSGDVADRTRSLLASLPLPDPARIILPDGLSLADWANYANKRLPVEADAVLREVTGYITDYGPIPLLTKLQSGLLQGRIRAIHITSAETATAALPEIADLKRIVPANLDVIALDAWAHHMIGEMTAAQASYSLWLQSAPPDSPARASMVENLMKARGGVGLQLANHPSTPGAVFRDCPDCPEMVVLPSGSFTMGSSSSEQAWAISKGVSPAWVKTESPQHNVSLQSFALAKYDVTFDDWNTCVSAGGCAGYRPADQGWGQGNRPVINVSWQDAKAYVSWLNSMMPGVLSTSGDGPYRLPSEAEWEYAARAGTTTHYYWGDEVGTGNANCDGCGSQWDNKQTSPVGSFRPNPFGLFDMAGNVWQWTVDCYADSYPGVPQDGRPNETGTACDRVIRGGSWDYDPRDLRSAYRGRHSPDLRNGNLGFRLARTLP